ncbi:unnamed protein product [Enterobius vermicularis]|uniref:Uncharacterized protein n=1 Tax=Enterobius vermicularis TaxID=51028 RepID=A0A3P6IWS0_ENTVE|nr:unnamed protein product [Enterobius vermicularis]
MKNSTSVLETLHKPYTIDLLTGTYYLFTPDNFFGDEFDVEIEGSYNVREAWTIATNVSQQLHYIDQRQFGKYVILQGSSAVSISNVLRYGDCGRDDSVVISAFVENVISELQYVTGIMCTSCVYCFLKLRMYIYNFNNTFLWFLAKGQYTLYVYTSGNNFVSGYTPRISGTLEISGNQMYFYICTNSETKLKLCVNLEGKQL